MYCSYTLHLPMYVQAKNSALAAAAIVPGSFEELEGTIRWADCLIGPFLYRMLRMLQPVPQLIPAIVLRHARCLQQQVAPERVL